MQHHAVTEQVSDVRCPPEAVDLPVLVSEELARALACAAQLLGRNEEEMIDAVLALRYS